MTCDAAQLILLQEGLTFEVRRHMDTCVACRALEELFALRFRYPPDLQNQIARRIVSDLKPVNILPGFRVLMLQALAVIALAIAAGGWYWENEGWKSLSSQQAIVISALLSAGLLIASDQIVRLIVPGSKLRMKLWLAVGTPLASLSIAAFFLFPHEPDPDFVAIGLHCLQVGAVCAVGTAFPVLLVLRRGVSVAPIWLGATTGLLCGLAGVSVLEIACPDLEKLHVGVWHLGTSFVSTLTGAIFAWAVQLMRARQHSL